MVAEAVPTIESPLHWDTNPVKLKELLTALDVDKAISTLSGIESDISAWSYVPKNNDETGGQIDLVIQRADRVINLCEMKYGYILATSWKFQQRGPEAHSLRVSGPLRYSTLSHNSNDA